MTRTTRISLPSEVTAGLEQAVHRLRQKVDAVYGASEEAEKMADLHYLAHELVDRQMVDLADKDPSQEQGALLDLRERVARHVHRLIEKTRRV
ncbi:MAG: hypothetical protein MI919_05125 [Holophagales bacterium]|nr:hypothetical protein [Holophagales bacterium]